MLIEPALVAELIKRTAPRDFLDPLNREAVGVLVKLHRAGTPIDIITIKKALECSPQFADMSVAVWLAETGYAVVGTAHFEHHLSQVIEASRKRQLFDAADHARAAALNGEASSEILANLWATVEDFCRDEESGRFNLITSNQLALGDYSVNYLIPGLLVEGQPCVLGGPKKALKTSALADLAIALDTGGCFFGYFPVTRPCRVWLLSAESGIATLKETTNRICETAGYQLADRGIVFSEQLPRFSNQDHIEEMGRILQGEGFDVVMVDPAYKCMDGENAGNVFLQGSQLTPITDICQEHNATLIVAHHARSKRANPHEPLDLDDLSWAGFAEHFRQWLLVNRREPFEPGSGSHKLWLGVGGSAGHHGLWGLDIEEGTGDASTGRQWAVTVNNPSETRQASQQARVERQEADRQERKQLHLDSDRKTIVDALRKCANRIGTKTSIRDFAGINSSRFNEAFATLLQDGTFAKTSIVKGRNQTYDAYAFSPDSQE